MRVGTSNATLGGNPMVGFHVLQGVEEVNGTLITVNSRSHLLRSVVHLVTVIDYRERDPSGRILPVTAALRVTTVVHLPTRCFPLDSISESLATDTTNRVPVSIEIH